MINYQWLSWLQMTSVWKSCGNVYVSIFEATIEIGWGYSGTLLLLWGSTRCRRSLVPSICEQPRPSGHRTARAKKRWDLGSDQAAIAGIDDWSLFQASKFATKQSRWCLMNHCDLFCYRTLAKIAPVVFSCNDVAPRFKTCITSLCGTTMILGTGNMNLYQVRHRTVRKGGNIKYIYIYVHT